MESYLYTAKEERKNYYIEKLLEEGIYKIAERQLYELPLGDLKRIYHRSISEKMGFR
ncbi:Fur-regulated basic protein FbpA [Heyndrickxia acidiproducens]|uniref:Fur-regulated basic protein FbpA n=1 Tax=Heyndrickxia acidiproducens TaxID=1121084 RepID=UPI000373C682|nr:Fur-regulated basic protein FbpA [Heyndrickxia acidiproducens]